MLNTLLFVHLIIAFLLITVILLQKTSSDGLSGIGGGGSNMGLMSARSTANFLTRTTVVLATLFFVNAIVLANLSSKTSTAISKKIEMEQGTTENEIPQDQTSLPVVK